MRTPVYLLTLFAAVSTSCSTATMTGAEVCDNARDDDGDEKTDCADPDCFGFAKCCVDQCDPTVSLCDDMGVRACVKNTVSGCFELASPNMCTGSNVCSGGACATSCTNRCAVGERQCIAAGAAAECQTLATGCRDWVVAQVCTSDKLCVAGSCAPIASCTSQCTVGQTRCTATGAQQVCATLGNGCADWTFPAACSNGMACMNGSCGGTGTGGGAGGGSGGGGGTGGGSNPPVPFGKVSAGTASACAITAAGGVMCWGYGLTGMLGDGTNLDHPRPVAVSGIASGATSISVGDGHVCAVVNGGVKCWGGNYRGQLGNGMSEDSKVPVDVTGLTGMVTQVVVGRQHSCALYASGAVTCWGDNSYKQLASTAVSSSMTPLQIFALTSGVTQLAAHYDRTCAINAGSLYCWGDGDPGSTVPMVSGVTRVALGDSHQCISTASAVQCWGQCSYGQCGNGGLSELSTPTSVMNISTAATMLALGSTHSCALIGGAVQCWGDSSQGQVGNGIATQSPLPVTVPLPAMADQITSYGTFTCAHLVDQTVRCWGSDSYGELGNGQANSVPTVVPGVTATQLAVTTYQVCALVSGGEVTCWGGNSGTSLGGPSTTASFVPKKVMGVANATVLALNNNATCVLVQGGGLKCWGYAPFVNGSSSDTPADIMGTTSNIAGLAAGSQSFCVRNDAGGVRCWVSSNPPQDVTGLSGPVTALGLGSNHTCALVTGGGMQCWGYGYQGQLGNGGSSSSSVPVTPTGLSTGVASFGTGPSFNCALMTNSGLKCWGQNTYGQLGNGQSTSSTAYEPDDVAGLSGATGGVAALMLSDSFSCARLSAGGPVKCWGSSHSQSITADGLEQHSVPIDFPALGNITQVAATSTFVCTLSSSGAVSCWGNNSSGQLGHPEFWTLPQAVQF